MQGKPEGISKENRKENQGKRTNLNKFRFPHFPYSSFPLSLFSVFSPYFIRPSSLRGWHLLSNRPASARPFILTAWNTKDVQLHDRKLLRINQMLVDHLIYVLFCFCYLSAATNTCNLRRCMNAHGGQVVATICDEHTWS